MYTRKPIVVVTDKKPARFDYWYGDTVLKGVT